jgi:hypothetical protein
MQVPHKRIGIRHAPPEEFAICHAEWKGEHRDTRRYTLAHEIRGFQRACPIRVLRYHYDVNRVQRIARDEGPARGAQERVA